MHIIVLLFWPIIRVFSERANAGPYVPGLMCLDFPLLYMHVILGGHYGVV